jgi:hypothetical protein
LRSASASSSAWKSGSMAGISSGEDWISNDTL